MRISLSAKIVVLSAILAFIFLAMAVGIVVQQSISRIHQAEVERTQAEIEAEASKIESQFVLVESTLATLAGTPPIQGMIRARDNAGFDELGDSSYEQWRQRLETIFASQIQSTTTIDQLRYLDVNGQELTRVNNVYGGGSIVPEDQLQDKSNRPYVQRINELESGELYISRIDLNREGANAEIEVPYTPVVRVGQPVFDEFGQRQGMVIINILFDAMLAQSDLQPSEQSELTIANEQGEYLYHPNSEKEWGSEANLNTGESLGNDSAYTAGQLFTHDSGVYFDDNSIVTATKLFEDYLNDEQQVFLIQTTSSDSFFSGQRNTILIVIGIAIVTFIILLFVFLFTVRYLLRPLYELSTAAEHIGKGEFDHAIDTERDDEIGVLAQSLSSMANQIKSMHTDLNTRIQEKTKSLNEKVSQLERTKTAMFNIVDDLDEEKQRVLFEVHKNEAIVQSIGDGLIVTDKDGTIEYVNKAFTATVGFTAKEAIGKKLSTLLTMVDGNGKKVPKKQRLITKALEDRTVTTTELRDTVQYQCKDKQLISVAITVSPIITEGEVIGAVEVFRDISQEVAVDKAKTEFVSLASHQLRTPLSTMNWYSEMLLSGDAGKLNTEQKNFVDEIYTGSQRMVKLVNSLLNVSRIELGTFAVEPEDIDVEKLMKELVKEMKILSKEKGIAITETYTNVPDTYSCDPKLLFIIVQNLLSNAVKYTPEDGAVELAMKSIPKKDILEISVKDNGFGIPETQQDKMFTKLFRADNVKDKDTTGTGLGLYIIKAILETAGGSIRFESEENVGTTFWVELPISGMKSKDGSKPLE